MYYMCGKWWKAIPGKEEELSGYLAIRAVGYGEVCLFFYADENRIETLCRHWRYPRARCILSALWW